MAGLTGALADAPGTAWAFARAGGVCPADLLDEARSPRARAALAGAVLAAVRAREGATGVAALVHDLVPVLGVRGREAAAARRARRWRAGAVGLLGAAASLAAPAEAYRRPGPGGRSPLDGAAATLAAWVGDAAADALDAAAARAVRGALAVSASQGGSGSGHAASLPPPVPTPADLTSSAFGEAVSSVARLIEAAGGVEAAPPAVVDALAALADGAAGRGGGRGGRGGARDCPPPAAAALATAAATSLASPPCAHYLISAPLRRALELAHTRPDGEAGDAGVGAARLTGALVVAGGGGGPQHLPTLLPPALAPFLDALCPRAAMPTAPDSAAPALAAAVFGALRGVVEGAGAAALPLALSPADPPPPPASSSLPFRDGPLARGGPIPADRLAGALAIFWRAALGAAAGVVVRALGGVEAEAAGAPTAAALPLPVPIPILTPALARAARGDLSGLLGAPRHPRPDAAGMATGGAGGVGAGAGAAPQGGSRPLPDPAHPPTQPAPGPPATPASESCAHADAACEALGLAAALAGAGRAAWAGALLATVRPTVVAATAEEEGGPPGGGGHRAPRHHRLAARVLASYDIAADAVAGADPASWPRLRRRSEEGGGGQQGEQRHSAPVATAAALAALPKGAALPALTGVWAVGPPLVRMDAAGKPVAALHLHWGGPAGPRAALVLLWGEGGSGGSGSGAAGDPLAAATGGAALALPSPVTVTGGLTVASTAGSVPFLRAGPGTRVVAAERAAVAAAAAQQLRRADRWPVCPPAARAPRLPVAAAEEARSPTPAPAPEEPEAAAAEAVAPQPPPPPPARQPFAELTSTACLPRPAPPRPAGPASSSPPPPPPPPPRPPLLLTPAACERLVAPLVAAGHARPAALRALLIARARAAARAGLGAGLAGRAEGGEEDLVRRALAYLLDERARARGRTGGGVRGVGGEAQPPLPPPPHNA